MFDRVKIKKLRRLTPLYALPTRERNLFLVSFCMRKVRVSMEKNFMHIGWVDYRDAGDTPRFLQAEDLNRFQEFGIILLHHPCQHIACLSENDDLDVLLVATSSQKGADIPYLCIDIPIGHHCVAPSTFGYFVGNVVLEWAAPGIKSKSDPNQFCIRAGSKSMIQIDEVTEQDCCRSKTKNIASR